MSADAPTAVLIFARAPIAGQAKTRLIPLLGTEGAARLQARMCERVLAVATEAAVGPVELWCTPEISHPFFAACGERHHPSLQLQVGASLGERLRHAHDQAFERHARILMIGTDCPVLSAAHLRRASHALRDHDAVITPAEDGGYVLLGLNRPCPRAFCEIDWSTEHVLRQTLARLRESGRTCHLSETLWDVDRPRDYERLLAAEADVVGLLGPDR